jgi:hypothetical protein
MTPRLVPAGLCFLLLAACGADHPPRAAAPATTPATTSATTPATTSGTTSPSPTFVAAVDNPWFPLTPGARWVYTGVKDGERARDVVVVGRDTKVVLGVRCVVVHDELYLSGVLHERTDDWYAQDGEGNVWYFGEATAELDAAGKVVSREGSWQAGVGGARQGIYLPGSPAVGKTGLQEYLKGHAEDHFKVLSLTASIRVPATSSHAALLTEEWTPLEPDVLDHKYYVRGIGEVKEQSVKGPEETLSLESYQRAS